MGRTLETRARKALRYREETYRTAYEIRRRRRDRVYHRLRPARSLTEVFRREPGERHDFTASVIFQLLGLDALRFYHNKGMSRRREFVIFVTLSVIDTLIINNLCMWAGEASARAYPLPHHQDRRHIHRHGVELRHEENLPRWRRRARRNAERARPQRLRWKLWNTPSRMDNKLAQHHHARRGIGGCAQRCFKVRRHKRGARPTTRPSSSPGPAPPATQRARRSS